jgi:hypothetical protein
MTTYEFYRPYPNVTNTTMTLDACNGVQMGLPSDQCSDLDNNVTELFNPWFAHLVEDQDIQPVGVDSNTVTWPPSLALMSQRVFPLAVGGGFYYGGSSGNSQLTANPINGQIMSVAIYRRQLNQADYTAVQEYLATRYNVRCVPLELPNVNSTCSWAPAGSRCEASCAAGTVQVGGASSLQCANGAWVGVAPVCSAAACASAPHVDGATACSATLVSASLAGASAASLAPVWVTLPQLPTRVSARYWSASAGGLVGSVPVADDACSFTEASALVINRPVAGGLRAAAAPGGSSSVTTTVTVVLDADAAGGVVGGVAFPEAVPGAPATLAPNGGNYSALRVTVTGGGSGGVLEAVVNGLVVASSALTGVAVVAGAPTTVSLTVTTAPGGGAATAAASVGGAAAGSL